MKKRRLYTALGLLAAFALWTVALRGIDVQSIGPQGSAVGFATLNGFVHQLIGTHMALYTITDWLSLVLAAFVLGFAMLGLVQWIQRRSLRKVDFSILLLGCFYLVTLAAFLFFESYVINYRPVLIEGYLEASYPSSTTLLVLCVMPTAIIQLRARIQRPVLRKWVSIVCSAFTVFMVVGRLISGVHWISDIIGGILLSAGLLMFYSALIRRNNSR